MLKTTTKLFCGGVLLATGWSAASAWAANPAELQLLLSAASVGADGKSPVAEADQLLREARQAMIEGNYEIADSKISRAEQLHPAYPFYHMGDTPKKVRYDLDHLMAQRTVDPNKKQPPKDARPGNVPADPFKARESQNSESTGPKPNNSAGYEADSTPGSAKSKLTMPGPELAAGLTGSPNLSQPVPSMPSGLRTPGSTIAGALGSTGATGTANGANGRRPAMTGDADGPNPWDVNPSANVAGPGGLARSPISGAHADSTAVAPNSGHGGTTPPAFEIAGALAPVAGRDDVGIRGNLSVSANVPDIANNLLPAESAARGLMNSPPVDMANPNDKQHALEMTRQARAAIANGDWASAEQFAHQAELLVPDTAYAAGEDRPAIVLLDIQRAKRAGGDAFRAGMGAVAAGADAVRAVAEIPAETNRYAVSNALYQPSNDPTQNVQATATMGGPSSQPSPENGTGEGQRWYQLGKEAMTHSRADEASQDFRRAYAFQAELDPATRRQLYDDLKILGTPIDSNGTIMPPGKLDLAGASQSPAWPNRPGASVPAVSSPVVASPAFAALVNSKPNSTGPSGGVNSGPLTRAPGLLMPGPLAAASSEGMSGAPPAALDNIPTPPVETQTLTRQVAAEVARQQSLARDMREKQPKQALESLQKTRDMVSSVGGMDPAAREQLLRRLDLSISDLQQYIAKNAPQIELDDKNRKVEEDVDNTRKQKVVVKEKLAYLVNDFNKAIDEQRYADAQLIAKKATELDPENPVVSQLNVMARQIPRMAQIDKLKTDKEAGVIDTLYAVDTASIPFAGDIAMPDAKKWSDLSKSPFRRLRDGQIRRTPKEMEIEQRLSTPMALKFDKRPLSEVIDYLGKIAQVPIYADPQGLQTEGVTSDTPITIDLSQDISLKSALNLILEPLHLTYVIKDEVLKITSDSVKRNELIQITYQVGDLVTRIPNFSPTGREGINGAMREAYDRQGWAGASGGAFGGGAPLTVAMSDPNNGASFTPNNSVLAQMQQHPGFPLIGGSGSTSSGTPQNIPFGPGGMKGGAQADFDPLIDLITSTIEKETWSEMGGNGTIEPFDTNLSLVISQTQEVHEKIADLLQQLRRLQDLQVTIEVRFITLEDDFFERMGVDFNFNITTNTNPVTPVGTAVPQSFGPVNPSELVGLDPTGAITAARDIQYRATGLNTVVPPFGPAGATADAATFGFAILNDIQAFFVIQAAQGDTRSNVLQAPKVTLFNGQQASVQDLTQVPFVISVTPVVGDFAAAQQPVIVVLSQGTSLTVQAVASNDRRFVRLTVVPFFSTIGQVNTFTFSGSSSTTQKSSDSKSGSTDTSNSSENDNSSTGTTVQLPQFTFTTVSTTVSVPDGGTVLLGGIKRLSEGRTEVGVPVLSKLPYINRLFRNTGIGRTTQSLMMMVTPRIIIQEEEAAAIEGTNNAP